MPRVARAGSHFGPAMPTTPYDSRTVSATMCAIASLEIEMRPSGVEISIALYSTTPGGSWLRRQQLRPVVPGRDPRLGVTSRTCVGNQFSIRVEVAAAGDRLGRGRRPAPFRCGRPEGEAAADPMHLPEDADRVRAEHEHLKRRDGGEIAVLEGERIRVAERRERPRELHHLPAVVDPGDLAADRLLDVPQEGAAAAAHVEQPVLLRQLQRLEQLRPEEVVARRRAVRRARLTAARLPRDLVHPAVEPPAG